MYAKMIYGFDLGTTYPSVASVVETLYATLTLSTDQQEEYGERHDLAVADILGVWIDVHGTGGARLALTASATGHAVGLDATTYPDPGMMAHVMATREGQIVAAALIIGWTPTVEQPLPTWMLVAGTA